MSEESSRMSCRLRAVCLSGDTFEWVVERTMAWLARYRRLTVRYERLVAVHRGFLHLACALICFNYLQRL